MLSSLGALFLIAFGSGVLAVAYRGWRDVELPAGAKGVHAYRSNREDSPVAFHVFLVLYVCGGIALAAWGCCCWSEWRRRWSCGECWGKPNPALQPTLYSVLRTLSRSAELER